NPFTQKSTLVLDLDKAAKLQRILNDLIGAMHVDTHKQLTEAWAAIIKRGSKAEEIAELSLIPMTEAQLTELAGKWDNDVIRNKTINEWVELAKAKYVKLAKASS